MNNELDYSIAEKVMKWTFNDVKNEWLDSKGKKIADHTWSPSSNIQDAWKIVEKFNAQGHTVHTKIESNEVYECTIILNGETTYTFNWDSDSIQLAI